MDKKILKNWVKEDAPKGDITSEAIFKNSQNIKSKIVAKQDIIVSGFSLVKDLIKYEFKDIILRVKVTDGKKAKKGQVIAFVEGPVKSVLTVERLILNLLQRLSGVATLTAKYVEKTKGTKTKILDTRKTFPGYRDADKKAVVDGGGLNHRMNLSDQYLIKDNHIDAAGGVIEAIKKVRAHQEKLKTKPLIEVEVRDEAEFCEALLMQVDIIMLDNMTLAQMKRLIKMRDEACQKKRPELEISGNVTLKNITNYVKLGVERISVGAITHSAPAVDISVVL